MLQVVNKSSFKQNQIICQRLNNLFSNNQDFWKEILNHESNFHLSNINGRILYNIFHDSKALVEVYTFKSKNPFTKSNGYTKPTILNKMWLNTRKFNRSEASIGATVGHETIHSLDAVSEFNFGHGDNVNTDEKQDCAPQFFAAKVYKHLSGGIVSAELKHEEAFLC